MPFAIRVFFNGVATGTIFNFDSEQDRDNTYDRFQSAKYSGNPLVADKDYTIDFTQVRMFEKL